MKDSKVIEPVKNIWCHYCFTEKEKELILKLVRKEFKLPVHLRRKTQKLVDIVKSY